MGTPGAKERKPQFGLAVARTKSFCWAAFTLSESNGRQLYVPAGFAHGYQTVSEVSVVVYKCSDYYSPDDEHVVRWDDDDLAISWPIRDALVSARDAAAPRLRDVLPEWLPRVDQ